jgi:hypothetical protein
MTSEYLTRPLRPLWKAQADTGRADYFRFVFEHDRKRYVLSLGKAWRDHSALRHAAGPDTSEILLWHKDKPRNDLLPSEVFPLLYPFDRFMFTEAGGPIGLNVSDSIVESLLYCMTYYLGKPDAQFSKLNGDRS